MRSRFVVSASLVALLLLILTLFVRPAKAEPEGKITVLVAASLTDLFKKAQAEFERSNPQVEVLLEPGASLTLIRKITDLKKEADIIAVADRTLIPTFLIPAHVDKSTDFLTEQIVLIIGDKAKHADTITPDNWHEILLRPGVEYGISDPENAPVGYRTLMVWKLAEQHYKTPGLYRKLQDKLPRKNIRSNASALLTLLTAGELDYAFDYASLAKQAGLRAIVLPPEVNLGDPQFSGFYKTVSVEIAGSEPGMKKTIAGEPIVYSMAVLKNAPHPKAAQAFVDFLLGPNGQTLMAQMGMTPLSLASR